MTIDSVAKQIAYGAGYFSLSVARVPFQHRGWCRVYTYIAGDGPVHTPAASVLVSENGVGKVNRVVVY